MNSGYNVVCKTLRIKYAGGLGSDTVTPDTANADAGIYTATEKAILNCALFGVVCSYVHRGSRVIVVTKSELLPGESELNYSELVQAAVTRSTFAGVLHAGAVNANGPPDFDIVDHAPEVRALLTDRASRGLIQY